MLQSRSLLITRPDASTPKIQHALLHARTDAVTRLSNDCVQRICIASAHAFVATENGQARLSSTSIGAVTVLCASSVLTALVVTPALSVPTTAHSVDSLRAQAL
eukprot:7399-Heterococcus_DN1.PRE.1